MSDTSEHLAAAIGARMDALGLSPTDLADRAGVTQQGLRNLRRGEIRKYQRRLTVPVCNVLGWTPDSIERLLAGDDPVTVEPVSSPESDLESRLSELEGQILFAVEWRSERLLQVTELLQDLGQRVAALEKKQSGAASS